MENKTIDDDDQSVSFTSTVMDEQTSEEERDEVLEVKKMSQAETRRVQLWRLATTLVLLLTAFAVTFTTYRFLKNDEKESFETAVSFLKIAFVKLKS